ncbi:MAG: hypothetical protein LQ350_005422 [Teloschistes chrysophthalmus]|nr:MAG: hypothetical protein LQ350_005422 [Niorma chrysophthalma]
MIGELSKDEEHSHINDAQYSQPLCTALQIGLVSLLRSWGVRPAVAVGHSSGEIAAAFAAGMISLRHAIITAYYRGYVLSSASMLTLNQSQGAMCAVGLGETECKALLRDHDKVQLAATNSPSSCTVSGDQLAIQAIIEVCSSQGHFCRLLKVDRAYHSDHMLPLASPYQLLLGQAGVTHSDEPNCSMFSSVTGQTLIPKHLTPSYWARNMTSTVRFAGATSECLENNPTVDSIIEIGPHPALKGPIQEILRQRRKDSLHYFTTCRRGADDYESMLNTAGEMIAAGSPLDLRAVNATDLSMEPYSVLLVGIETAKDILESADIHFVSRIDETLPRMSFEIFRTKFDGADEWVLCASGLLKLSSCMPPESYDEVHIVQQNHMLLQQAQSLYPDSLDMDNLQMGSCVMSGEAAYRSPTIFSYPIHPLALATVLSLGPIPLVCTNLPAKYRISSIPTLKMSITDKGAFTPEFVIDANYDRAGGAVGKVQVRQGINTALDGTIAYSATELIAPKPAMSSLFFKPVRLPDITRRLDFEEFDIKELLTLVTHKWPMADIILDNIPAPAQEKILSVLDAQGGNPKQRYRSIQILGDFDLTDLRGSSRIVKELSPHVSAHIVFALSDRTVIPLVEKLRPSGLVCIRGSPEENRERFTEQLDFLFRINGVDEQPWALWRLRNNDPSNLPKHERVVFCSQNLHIKHSWLVDLEPSAVETFMNEQCTERFNAIVVDDLGKSVIASWAGRYLVPWLQYLIKHSKSLLWVTLDAALNPFVGLAGSLLRTLQAEQPSLKVSWLCLSQTQFNQHSLEAEIEDAFQAMLRGDNEVQSEVDPTGTRIIRYLPDENLSAATGASLPRLVSDPLGEKDYALAMAGPREPVILSYDPSSSTAASTGLDCDSSAEQLSGTRHSNDDVNHSLVKVSVKASMNAGYDLAAYAGDMACDEAIQTPGQEDRHALGTFFAGTVLLSPDASFPEGSHVAGWSHGAHVNVLDVPAQNVYSSRDNNHGRTVSDFATYANMVAALDGHIRVRDDDVVRLEDPSDRLHQSFDRTCTSLRFPNLATISSSDGTEKAPTFTLKIGNNHALLADDKPIDVARYLCSNPPAMRKVWDERQSLEPLIEVPFKHFKDLFKSAAEDPEPRVLIHGDLEGVSHVPIYRKPSNIVSSKGAHIIIGGLGGLGRYLCSWLVEQGARTIYAISRSGISSPEAQQMSDNLNSTPCIKFEAIKADACDRTSMSAILSTIRSQHPIVGVTNMAMVLSDAPMASMMAEEWDRALRAKIDSSWILHELTKGDELEYFVLFSSIASVLGNRNQGSYNVGNTFLNALATYRRRIGKTAVAIALGAMSVLTTLPLSTPSTTTTTTTANILTRSGLTHLTTTHLDKILQAAIHNSNSNPTTTTTPDEAIILTGLETFQRTHNGALAGKKGGVYWMDLPEFSHLAVYTSPFASADDVGGSIGGGLKERIISCIRTRGDGREGRGGKEMGTVVEEGVLSFLEGLLGVREGDLDRGVGMGVYGMDSLAAVGVQLWCFRDLGIDVTVPEILAARNLEAFITTVKVRVGERYRGEKEG